MGSVALALSTSWRCSALHLQHTACRASGKGRERREIQRLAPQRERGESSGPHLMSLRPYLRSGKKRQKSSPVPFCLITLIARAVAAYSSASLRLQLLHLLHTPDTVKACMHCIRTRTRARTRSRIPFRRLILSAADSANGRPTAIQLWCLVLAPRSGTFA